MKILQLRILSVATLGFFLLPFKVQAQTLSTSPIPSTDSKFRIDGFVAADARHENNVFRANKFGTVSDEIVSIKPGLGLLTKPGTFSGGLRATALYEKYRTYSIQNHFDYKGEGELKINEFSPLSFNLTGSYYNFSDLSPTDFYGRIDRTQLNSSGTIKYKTGKSEYKVVGFYLTDDITDIRNNDPTLYSNVEYKGLAEYRNYFLPETAWIMRGTIGIKKYPQKALNETGGNLEVVRRRVKNDSAYSSGELGVQGRLTDKAMIDCATGLLFRKYDSANSSSPATDFAGPIFTFRYTEQVTKRDQITAGYDYQVYDAYSTNYFLDQSLNVGFARVFGDQILAAMRIDYLYRSYSAYERREDQRISGSLLLKYSYSSSLKVFTKVSLDLLSSDGWDTCTKADECPPPANSKLPFPLTYDQAASYQSGAFAIGAVSRF